HFAPYFIAAAMNSGANNSLQMARFGPKPQPHFANPLLHNSSQRAAPTCVENSNGSALGINQNYGQAVGSLDSEYEAGCGRDQAVAGQRRFSLPAYAMNDIGVDLP